MDKNDGKLCASRRNLKDEVLGRSWTAHVIILLEKLNRKELSSGKHDTSRKALVTHVTILLSTFDRSSSALGKTVRDSGSSIVPLLL